MITENLSALKIHKLSQAQYDRELAAGRLDENALYLTPDEGNVLFSRAQNLNAHEQEQARANIGALSIDAEISSEKIVHGAEYLNNIIEAYILNIDYSALAFDTTEVIVGSYDSSTTSMLGQAILGKMILA